MPTSSRCYSPNDKGIIVPTDAGVGLNTSASYKPCVKCFIGNGYETPLTYYACDCVPEPDGGIETHSGVDLSKPASLLHAYFVSS